MKILFSIYMRIPEILAIKLCGNFELRGFPPKFRFRNFWLSRRHMGYAYVAHGGVMEGDDQVENCEQSYLRNKTL